MITYYFASRYSRANELAGYRDELQAAIPGAIVTSRWLDHHDGALEQSCTPEYLNAHPDECWQHGLNDLDDLDQADVIVSFTGAGGKGGRHIEHGYALACHDRVFSAAELMRLVVVGQRENVFHCHPDTEVYTDWATFLESERKQAAVRAALEVRSCSECGCTDEHACQGGCWWVGPSLCSACAAGVRP